MDSEVWIHNMHSVIALDESRCFDWPWCKAGDDESKYQLSLVIIRPVELQQPAIKHIYLISIKVDIIVYIV